MRICEYQGFKIADKPLLFRVGNFKTFNTFEEETSANYLDTMERAAFINAWDIDRQIGVRHHVLCRPLWLGGRYLRPGTVSLQTRTRRSSRLHRG